jgi:hypothetical protein
MSPAYLSSFLIQGFILKFFLFILIPHHSTFRRKKDAISIKQERNVILFSGRMDSLRTDFIFAACICVAYKN